MWKGVVRPLARMATGSFGADRSKSNFFAKFCWFAIY